MKQAIYLIEGRQVTVASLTIRQVRDFWPTITAPDKTVGDSIDDNVKLILTSLRRIDPAAKEDDVYDLDFGELMKLQEAVLEVSGLKRPSPGEPQPERLSPGPLFTGC